MIRQEGTVKLFWWSVMVAAIFWTLVYQLASAGAKLPDFVYVNF